jgi:hypothetical protein
MEQIAEAGTGKPVQLTMVAKGRADHENVARRAAPAERVRTGARALLRDILHRCASKAGVVSLTFPMAFRPALQLVPMLIQVAPRGLARGIRRDHAAAFR